MKTFSSICVIASFGFVALGQSQQTASVPAPSPYTIVSRDANSRVWDRTTYELSASGQVIPHVDRYTEMATGLCYKQNAQWMDSQEQINIMPDGSAEAIEGRHQAYFPINIYNGVIKLVTPDGLKLLSQPVGISYNDGANTVLIAALTNSVGELISSNEVIYPNAFAGVSADLLYTYRKSGFEQDVIFREQPPTPEQVGLSSTNSRLQLLTEFFNPPIPVEHANPVNSQDGLQDTTLNFGATRMIQGKAFLINTTDSQNNLNQILVYKSWTVVDGRTLLIEEVPYQRIASQLATLPQSSGSTVTSINFRRHKVSSKRFLPPVRLVESSTNFIRLAENILHQDPGVVFDYVTMDSSETNYIFQGDTTYFVSGDYELSGATVLEGGTVIKMNDEGELDIEDANNYQNDTIDCETAPYRPAIFTSMNDNTVGHTISGSSGDPSDRDVGTFLEIDSTNIALSNVHFNYCDSAIYQYAAPGILSVQDSQFNQIETAISAYNINLYNVLIVCAARHSWIIDCDGSNFIGEQITADGGNALVGSFSGATAALTNCLVTTTNSAYALTNYDISALCTNDVVCLMQPSLPVYQTVGGGSHYLATGSPYRGVGTTNIDPALLADLAQKTTWPPIVYADTNISGLGTLGPQAPRDISSAPDLGYHYDPLDYVFGGGDLHSNLTFTTGTAVGWFQEEGDVSSSGQPYAISLNNGANLSFNGNATQPCYFARSALVQEGGNGNWTGSGYMGGIMFNGSSAGPEPQLSANFTKWTMDSLYYNFFRDNLAYGAADLKNCEFYDGSFAAYDMQNLTWTNCLFFRGSIEYYDQDYAPNITYENCTFYNGDIDMERYTYDGGYGSAYWLVENCSYDGTAFEWNDARGANTNYTLFNYNAYNTNNLSWTNYSYPYPPIHGTLETVGSNDLMVTNYNWQTSWFGNFYLPPWPDSPLLGMGSTNSNFLGLYHFTTQTNANSAEGDSIVDIGYHYVATDQNGNPLDSNNDGIPDYLEDPQGNGLDNSGQIAWDHGGDLGLTVIITQPRNGSTLP